MKSILIHPTYFGPISQYVEMLHADEVVLENEDNYQKQTFRNRMYIYGANGRLLLNIPIKHKRNADGHQKYKEVEIENDFDWQKLHWKSLETAYRSSPFFEFYEDEIIPLYQKPFKYLLDFNYQCLEIILDSLQLKLSVKKTATYDLEPKNVLDKRSLVNAKKEVNIKPTYVQVFEDKKGFLSNLSILDLLFNEGTNTVNYLKEAEVAIPQV